MSYTFNLSPIMARMNGIESPTTSGAQDYTKHIDFEFFE